MTYGSDVLHIKQLLENKNVGLINAISIKPMDYEMLEKLKQTRKLIIYEQVNNKSSLGEQIKLILGQFIDIVHISLEDTYLTEGKVDDLRTYANIEYSRIINEL